MDVQKPFLRPKTAIKEEAEDPLESYCFVSSYSGK